MRRHLRTSAVAAIAVLPWLPAVATGGGVASSGKAGSITAMGGQGLKYAAASWPVGRDGCRRILLLRIDTLR